MELSFLKLTCDGGRRRLQNPEVVFSWVGLEYDYPSPEARLADIQTGLFIPENNYIHEVEVFEKEVFITCPRDKLGVPATLNTVIKTPRGPILKPFPGFSSQQLEDCNDVQFLYGIEVDPNTGKLYAADVGRSFENDISKACPPKLLIYDIRKRQEEFRYVFPENVASRTTNAFDYIVLDYVDGKVGFVYISDFLDSKLVVYDVVRDTSHFVQHESMFPDPTSPPMVVNGILLPFQTGINGIALDYNFEWLFWDRFPGSEIFQVPTAVLRNRGVGVNESVRGTGRRRINNFAINGIFLSSKSNMFINDVTGNAIRKWSLLKDTSTGSLRNVMFSDAPIVAQDANDISIPTGVTIDRCGYLWFAASKLHEIATGILDVTGGRGTNAHVWRWKLPRRERHYLYRANKRTRGRF